MRVGEARVECCKKRRDFLVIDSSVRAGLPFGPSQTWVTEKRLPGEDQESAAGYVLCWSLGYKNGKPGLKHIDRLLNFARNPHIEARVLEGGDVAPTLVEFVRLSQVPQIFFAGPRYRELGWLPGANLIHRVVRLAKDVEVAVVAQRRLAD